MVWNYKYNDECQYHWQSTFVDRCRRRSISLFLSICLTFLWQLDIVQLHRFNDKLYSTLGERGYNVGRVSLLERVYSLYDSLISVAKLSHESATAPRITVQRTGRFYSFTASLARAHTHILSRTPYLFFLSDSTRAVAYITYPSCTKPMFAM